MTTSAQIAWKIPIFNAEREHEKISTASRRKIHSKAKRLGRAGISELSKKTLLFMKIVNVCIYFDG